MWNFIFVPLLLWFGYRLFYFSTHHCKTITITNFHVPWKIWNFCKNGLRSANFGCWRAQNVSCQTKNQLIRYMVAITSNIAHVTLLDNFCENICRLCCQCGVPISPNPANMCVACIRTQVDITADIPKQVVIYFCRFCER